MDNKNKNELNNCVENNDIKENVVSIFSDKYYKTPALLLNKLSDHNIKLPKIHIFNELLHIKNGINILKNKNYQAVFPKDILEKLKSGEITWSYDINGEKLPILKNQKGYYSHQLRLKEVSPMNSDQINNLSSQYLSKEILKKLDILISQGEEILKGQNIDRIGIITGSIQTYKQAVSMKNNHTRQILLSNSISELNKGREQLIESFNNKVKIIDKIPESSFPRLLSSFFNIIDINKIQKEYDELNIIFNQIVLASKYLTVIYQDLDELESVQKSLGPLINFLDNAEIKMINFEKYLPYDEKNIELRRNMDIEGFLKYIEISYQELENTSLKRELNKNKSSLHLKK